MHVWVTFLMIEITSLTLSKSKSKISINIEIRELGFEVKLTIYLF